MDWTNELDKQLSWHWENALRPRLDGLTDQEYFWEPVPGMWSVRSGRIDFSYPPPTPEPVTTIAWRIGHLLVGVFAQWIAGVRSMDDDGLHAPCDEHGFEQDPMAGLILHIHREVIHHGAEICLLRDLYRWQN
jgi:hypothetical protein